MKKKHTIFIVRFTNYRLQPPATIASQVWRSIHAADKYNNEE